MKISVVVPAYNETDRIVPSLERIISYLQERHPDFEILVVDDGSADATAATVRQRFEGQPRVSVLSYGINRGKGFAVRHGMGQANGDLVLFSDADLSTPIEEIEGMLPLIENGYDVVIGSRAHAEADIRQRQPLYRELGGKLFNLMVRIVVMPELYDTQCGFKLFRRSRIAPILPNLCIDGFAFDVEILALAGAAGLRIAEVPVIWINSRASRVRMSAALRASVDLIGIRARARQLRASVADRRRPETAPPAQ